jgi:hypothetical protein
MLAFWFILPYSIYKSSATFKDHFAVALEDQHLFLENERGTKTWPWSAFSNVVESPHFFHLYFDSRSFFLLPKEAFEGNALPEARQYIKARVKN